MYQFVSSCITKRLFPICASCHQALAAIVVHCTSKHAHNVIAQSHRGWGESKHQMMSVTPTLSLKGHTDSITSAGKLGTKSHIVVTASRDRSVKLWNLHERRCLRTFTGYEDVITDVSVIDDSKVLVLCRRTVQVLDVLNGHVLAQNIYPNFLWGCAALSSDSAIVGDELGNIYKIGWDDNSLFFLEVMNAAHDGGVHRVYKYGSCFATCSVDGTAKLWDSHSMSLIFTYRGHTNEVCYVVFDDQYLVTSSIDSTVRVYSVIDGSFLCTLDNHTPDLNFIHIVAGANVVIVNGDGNDLALHALPSGKCLTTCDVGMVLSAVVQLTSRTLVIGGYNPYDVNVFDINHLFKSVNVANQIDDLVLTRLNVAGGWEKYARLLERRLGEALLRITHLENKLDNVTDKRIAKLEKSLKRLSVSQEGDVDQCCVCLEPYRADDLVFRLPCLHVHHADCLLPSLEKQDEPKCPICRMDVPVDDIVNLTVWKWVPPAASSSPTSGKGSVG